LVHFSLEILGKGFFMHPSMVTSLAIGALPHRREISCFAQI
jgi:hypothetical protein